MYKELNEIKEKLRLLDLYDKYFKLDCYDSGSNTALYGYEDDNYYHEIAIINEECSFFRDQEIKELIEHKDLFFAQYSIYQKPLEVMNRTYQKCFHKFDYIRP